MTRQVSSGIERVHDFAELRKFLEDGYSDFFIALNGGAISRKQIWHVENDQYEVFHGIDGSVEALSEAELVEETNIGKALIAGAFYVEK